MSGWSRLAIFLATLVAAPVFMLGYGDAVNTSAKVEIPVSALDSSGSALDQVLLAEARKDPDQGYRFQHCAPGTVKEESVSSEINPADVDLSCKISPIWAIWRAFKIALIPWIVVFSVVLAIGWVANGFKRRARPAR